jgi:hypothetical protein
LSRRVVLALPFLLAAASTQAAEAIVVGTVSRLVGQPSMRVAGGRNVALARGMLLHEGDRIATGPGGRLEITATDGTTIAVGEQTTLVLSRFVAPRPTSAGQGLLDLLEGILRLNLPNAWDRFQVTTGTAVASVRSTDWMIEATADNTAVFVAEGRVEVENTARTGAVLLDPAFGTDVQAGALPTTPKRWGQARVDSVLARTQVS